MDLSLAHKNALTYLSAQQQDGLWAYLPGNEPSLEASCWAAIASRSDKKCLSAFLAKIFSLQNNDGGWSNEPSRLNSDWSTATALMCFRVLLACSQIETLDIFDYESKLRSSINRAFSWLIENRTERYSPSARFALMIWRGAEYDYQRGWPWTPDTFDWVEPTSYALIGLHLLDQAGSERVQRIISNAEEYLLSLAIKEGGGWNFGDRNPLGQICPPDIQSTTLALLALRRRDTEAKVQSALKLLQERKYETQNERAWGALALRSLKGNFSNLLTEMLSQQKVSGEISSNLLTQAVACLALDNQPTSQNLF